MAITVESYTYATIDSTNSITVSAPSNIQSGDFLLVAFSRDAPNPESVPANYYNFSITGGGFTEFIDIGKNDSDTALQVFYRVADGTEASSITATSTQSRDSVAFYIRLTGVDTSSPINVTGTEIGDTSPPIDIGAVTTTADGCMAFAFFNFDGGDGDPFSFSGTGWPTTPIYQESGNLGSYHGCGWETKTVSSAGSSSAVTLSNTGNADGVMGIQFALTASPVSGYANKILGLSSASKFSGVNLSDILKISGV